jgi:anti-sigma factor RsiW
MDDRMNREHLELLRRLPRDLRDESWTHLDDETQAFAYVDGTLDAIEREIVETHLEDCELCSAVVADLRVLRDASRQRIRRRRAVAVLATAAAITFVTAALLRRPAPLTPAAVTTQAAVVAPQRDARDYGSPAWNELVRQTVATGDVAVPAAVLALRSWPTEVRGGKAAGERVEVAPSGTAVVDERPTFSWPAVGRSYRVRVFRGEREVADSGVIAVTTWRPARPLAREETHLWQVEVDGTRIIPPPTQPPASFRIVSAADARDLAAARAQFPSDHLLLGALHARAGALAEAEEEFRKLAAEEPDSELAKRLCANLQRKLARS